MRTVPATAADVPERPSAAGFEVAQWVTASCARQGVAPKVTDAHVVARVAVLLSGRRAGSEPPDGLDSGGVQRPRTADPWSGQGGVEQRGDDAVTRIQPECGPWAS